MQKKQIFLDRLQRADGFNIKGKENSRNLLLDLLKVFGALIISLLHLDWKISPGGYLFVEMFFLMTGFLLAYKEKQYSQLQILDIFKKRISSFYFYYFIAFLFAIYLIKFPTGFEVLNYFTFMSSLGLGSFYGFGALWFLGIYLFFSVGYIYLRKITSDRIFKSIVASVVILAVYTLYAGIPFHGINLTYERFIGPFPVAFYRGLIGIGGGYLTFYLAQRFKLFFNSYIALVLGTVIFGILVHIIFRKNYGPQYDYLSYLIFGYLISFCFFSRNVVVVKLNNFLNTISVNVFTLFLEIYIFHSVVIGFSVKLSNEVKLFLVEHYLIYLILVLFFSLLMKKMKSTLVSLYKRKVLSV